MYQHAAKPNEDNVVQTLPTNTMNSEPNKEQSQKAVITIKENEVVDVINKHRGGIDEEVNNTIVSKELALVGESVGIKAEKFEAWCKEDKNYEKLGRGIISLTEQSDIVKQYTTLNDEFTKRLTDENRATDIKDTGDKRIKNSPPENKFRKRWRVESLCKDK
ncbi:unnamed protein product [Rhizophagus irregularis]|nr:unnamed protein product [Rhizophagus irregularis]